MKFSAVTLTLLGVLSLLMMALGFLVGSEWGSAEDLDDVKRSESPADQDDGKTQTASRTKHESQEPSRIGAAKGESLAAIEVPLFSAALMTHFRVEYEKAWNAERQEKIGEKHWETESARFKDEVLSLPGSMGKSRALDANERDRIQAGIDEGDQSAILEAVSKGIWKPDDKTFGAELMDRVLKPQIVGGTESGPSFQRDRKLKSRKGLSLFFPAGIHKLDSRRLTGAGSRIPEDITITGAGMDQTLLQLGELDSRGVVKRLRFQDLTIDMGNDYFFDLRGKHSLSIDMTRARLVRFDMGAGGSLAFSVGGGAIIRATDCEFLGGYGRNPGSGNLYRGNPGWMRFSRCRFSLLDLNLRSSGALRFDDCDFANMRQDPRLQHPKLFRGGSYTPPAKPRDYRRPKPISLSTIFPDFK